MLTEKLIDNINVKPIDKDCIAYYGYYIYRNGNVTTKNGKPLQKFNLHYPYSHIKIQINKKSKRLNVARLIYGLFHELDTGETISNKSTLLFFKDNDSRNVSFDNLEVVSKKEGYARLNKVMKQDKNTGYFLPKFTAQQAEEIRGKYLGASDGRRNRNQYAKTTPSIRELAKEYGCSAQIITKIIKGEYNL